MAKVGGGAAYSQLRPIDDGINQGLQYWGGIRAQENAAQKLADEREAVRKSEALSKWEEDYKTDAASFQGKHTGFTQYDDIIADASSYMRDEYLKVAELELQARRANNTSEATKYYMEKQRILNDFKQIKKGDEAMAEIFKNYQTAAQNNKVSPASREFESILESIYKDKDAVIRYKTTPDGRRELVVTGLTHGEAAELGIETDPKAPKDKPFEVPFSSIFDGEFTWIEPVNYGELVKNISAGIGLMEQDAINGDYRYTNKTWESTINTPEKVKDVKATISSHLSEDTIADLLTRPMFKDIAKLPEEQQHQAIVDRVYNSVKMSKEQSSKVDARDMTVSETRAENRENRNFQQRMQERRLAAQEAMAEKAHQNALEILEKQGENRAPTQAEIEQQQREVEKETLSEIAVIAHEIATSDKNDSTVKEIIRKSGLPLKFRSDWNIGSGNEFDILAVLEGGAGTSDIDQANKGQVFGAITKAMGLDVPQTDYQKFLDEAEANYVAPEPTPAPVPKSLNP